MWGTTLEFLKRMNDKRRRSKVRKRNLLARAVKEQRRFHERKEPDKRTKLLEQALRAIDKDFYRGDY